MEVHAMRRTWLPGLVLAASVIGSGTAAGQSPASPPRWEVEFHGGGIQTTTPTDGTSALPSPGLTAPNGSRPVSSWYFGDGASQLNQMTSSRRIAQNVSLDPVLQRPFVQRRSGGTVGFRISRELTRRLAAELTFDYNLGTLALTSESTAGIEATRAGFVAAFNGLLSGGFFGTRTVSSVATIADRQGRQITTAGTVLFNLKPGARLAPYVALGAAAISNRGEAPSAALAGDYQFVLNLVGFPGPAPTFRQTDSVTVRSVAGNSLAWVVGGGVKYAVSERWGVRVDVRDLVSGNTLSTLVDATPASATPTTSGVLILFSLTTPPSPLLVFSGASGTPSTLSGPSIAGFKTFSGTGTEHHVNVTAGLFWRF
jgi:opacity protein-like surface antigen